MIKWMSLTITFLANKIIDTRYYLLIESFYYFNDKNLKQKRRDP
ncbi:MAG: hypothetical protein ACI9IP_000667 [Arcticibacterium sp.]|jgi:hypothetical protein